MPWTIYITVIGQALALLACIATRRWRLAAAFACLTALTLFDKLVPGVLPEAGMWVFGILVLLLADYEIFLAIRQRRERNAAAKTVAA